MHVLQGDFGPGKTARAPADPAVGKVDNLKRHNPAAFARRPPEAAPFEARPSPERPPRVGAGSSEIVILDGDGVIVVVNETWRATIAAFGVVLRDAGIGSSYVAVAARFLPDLNRDALELSLGRLLAGEVKEVRRTYAVPTPRGPRWRHVQITPLSSETGGRFVAIHEDLTDLALAQEALKVSSEQLLTAKDDERQRIALELHDSTLQHLAAISFGLAKLRRAAPRAAVTTIIDDIAISLNEAVKETRVLSYLVKPRGLARSGLSGTVRQFLEGFGQRTGLQVTLEAELAVDRAPAPVQHAALRIVQEALLNANRHAQARRVSVELAVDDEKLTVSIADDGRGMTGDRRDPCLGVGIPGMHARAQQVSGELEIASDACGTRVMAWLPLT